MLARLPHLSGKEDPTSQAVARALRTAALKRVPAEEREWIARVDARRRELIADQTSLPPGFDAKPGAAPEWIEQGAGAPIPIGGVACLFSVAPRWGTFLLRLVREIAPKSCLELGTGLGISTAYQAAALELNQSGTMTTLEGAKAWASIAEEGLAALGLSERARVEPGPIDATLTDVVARIAPIDYAYLDADHTEKTTTAHFDVILPHVAEGGIVVLDDISYSGEMWRAWRAVTHRDRVSTALALGRMGLVAVR